MPEVSERSGKVIFADQLRAVAAVSVMIVHLLGVYWAARDVVAAHIFAPVLEGPSARSLQVISPSWFNFGPFGVALFFLVSGFVIPFSVSKSSRLRFLAARALRIYPTYIACLFLGGLAIWASSAFWGRPFGWSITTLLQNALLVQNLAGVDSVDMVNWSLSIEIKFYLIVCLMAAWVRQSRIAPLLILSVVLALGIYAVFLSPVATRIVASVRIDQIAHDLLFMPFMFAGTMFSYRFRGRISRTGLVISVLGFFSIFIAAWRYTVLKDYFPLVPLNYFYALCVFSAAFALRGYCRPVRALDWLASISYPLYALHPLVGYSAIRLLTAVGVPYYPAVGIAAALIAALAYAVHRVVEMPTQEMGKRIMKASTPSCSEDTIPPGCNTATTARAG